MLIAPMLSHTHGREEALTNRVASQEEAAMGARGQGASEDSVCHELEAKIAERHELLHLGAALLRVAEERKRLRELPEAAHACSAAAFALGDPPTDPSASCSAKGGIFERRAFGMWARALQLLGDHTGEEAVHALGVARSVWVDRWQRPVELLERTLHPRRP